MSDHLLHQIVAVTDVAVIHDRVVRLTFDDGCVGELDLAPTFERLGGEFFTPLAEDDELFGQVRVDPEGQTIEWPNGADLAPEVLHAAAAPDCRHHRQSTA
jgi:hypothetical protein